MIQVNLIPDVKQEYLKAQKIRNMVISISILTMIGASVLVVVMGTFVGGQAYVNSQTQEKIEKEFANLQAKEDVDKLVTIQNQLTIIDELNQNRSMKSRLFAVLEAIRPSGENDISFSTIRLDPETNVLYMEGSATGGYPAVETFKKTITQAKVTYVDNTLEENSERLETTLALDPERIIISDTNTSEDTNGQKVLRFAMSFEYDPILFNNTVRDVKLVLPDSELDVTDSTLRVPQSLFTDSVDEKKGDE